MVSVALLSSSGTGVDATPSVEDDVFMCSSPAFGLDPPGGVYSVGLRVSLVRGHAGVCYWRLRVRGNIEIRGRSPARVDFPFEEGYCISESRCGYCPERQFAFLTPGEYAVDLSPSGTFSDERLVVSTSYSVLCTSLCFCFVRVKCSSFIDDESARIREESDLRGHDRVHAVAYCGVGERRRRLGGPEEEKQ